MSPYQSLLDLIQTRQATVGIIGLGYVGLPLAETLHGAGLSVIGFDTDRSKIRQLDRGEAYLKHLGTELVESLASSERFQATSDFERLAEVDAVIVCVPTPLGPHQEPDLSYVTASARAIGRTLRAGQLIVLGSTTYPGTTRESFLPALYEVAQQDLKLGRDFFVAFSPEREDPGRRSHSTRTTPKLVGGLDESSSKLACALYETGIQTVIPVRSAEVAEAAKILENVFRSVNIALVNELKVILNAMDIDVWEVIEAASTKPFGFMPFHPGPGLGGHCIPIDPFYLTWRARECGQVTRFIELAGEINRRMPQYVVDRVAAALNDDGKPLRGSRVLVAGLAYKPNVDDTRETPAAEILSILTERGAEVAYHDPHVPQFPPMRNYDFSLESVELSDQRLRAVDCVLVVTHHTAIDWSRIGEHARLIVDTRNVMAEIDPVRARVVKA